MQKKLGQIFSLTLITLCAIAYVAWATGALKKPDGESYRPAVAGVKVGGAFDLVDHNGNAVSDQTYKGKHLLMFFGFTYCPAICPTELQKITSTMQQLPPELADKIQPLYITVDPERDTVEIMKDYVSLYDPRITGLTGSRAQIDDVISKYKIYAQKVEDPDYNDYMMDHSANTYFMSPDGELLLIFKQSDRADAMATKIQGVLD